MAQRTGHLPEHRSPLDSIVRRLTTAYIVMGLLVLASAALAVFAMQRSSEGVGACTYQKAIYPASRSFKVEIKGFLHDHYIYLRREAAAYRASAAQDPDTATARLDLGLAKILEHHAAHTFDDWQDIHIPGPPTCHS